MYLPIGKHRLLGEGEGNIKKLQSSVMIQMGKAKELDIDINSNTFINFKLNINRKS